MRQAAEHDVAFAGQVVHQRGVHAEQRGLAVGVDPAARRRQQTGDRPQQRRLARAVGADDADRLAAVGGEAHALDRVHPADVAATGASWTASGQRRGRAALAGAGAVDRVDDVHVVTITVGMCDVVERLHGGAPESAAQPRPYRSSAFQKKMKPPTPTSTAQPTATGPHVRRQLARGDSCRSARSASGRCRRAAGLTSRARCDPVRQRRRRRAC